MAQSAGHQLSSRIIDDTITHFITPLSTFAQSDLNPTYKIPRMIEKVKEEVDFVIQTLQTENKNNNFNCIVPPNLKKYYLMTNEISIVGGSLAVTPELNQYQHCWKKLSSHNSESKMNELKDRLTQQRLNTTSTYMVDTSQFCGICGLGTYVEDTTLLWIYCDECGIPYHRNNDLQCYTDDKSDKYWDKRSWICSRCNLKEDDDSSDDGCIFVLSDDEEEVKENSNENAKNNAQDGNQVMLDHSNNESDNNNVNTDSDDEESAADDTDNDSGDEFDDSSEESSDDISDESLDASVSELSSDSDDESSDSDNS